MIQELYALVGMGRSRVCINGQNMIAAGTEHI